MEFINYISDIALAVSDFYGSNPMYAYFTYIGFVVLLIGSTKLGD